MDNVQMIKEEIRRRMEEAKCYNDKWLQAFKKDGDATAIRLAGQYASDFLTLKSLLIYIEQEVK